MATRWLKTLGMGAHGEPFPDDWVDFQKGFFLHAVTFNRRPQMRRGNGIVYYAAGVRVVFAVGHTTSLPYKVTDAWTSDWPWVVNVSLHSWREFVHDGIELEQLSVGDRDLRRTIKRRSHIRLTEPEYASALALLSS